MHQHRVLKLPVIRFHAIASEFVDCGLLFRRWLFRGPQTPALTLRMVDRWHSRSLV